MTKTANVANAQQKYAVDCMLLHVGKGNNVRYVVHWYSYTTAVVTVELAAPIPEHSFTSFWCRLWRQEAELQRLKKRNTARHRTHATHSTGEPASDGTPKKQLSVPKVHCEVVVDPSKRRVTAAGFCTL